MSRLGFGPSNLRFALACLGVAVGLSAPLGPNLRSEVLLANEAASPSARMLRVEVADARPAAGDQLAKEDGSLSEAELRRSIRDIGHLSTFFGHLATQDPTAERRSYWEDLRLGYAAAAGRLGGLLDSGGLTVGDLPAGQRASSGGAGILIDSTLDGAWRPDEVPRARAAGQDDWNHTHRLTTAVFESLASLESYGRWSWFDAHLKRSPTAGVMEPGSESVAGPLLTRYWFAKDWHLWASVAGKAAGERTVRELWAARRAELATQAGMAVEETRDGLGEAWYTALSANWQQQVAEADDIAATHAGNSAMAGFFSGPSSRTAETTDGQMARAYGELEAAQQADQRRLAELETERRANQQRVAELEAARTADLARVAELEQRLAELDEALSASLEQSSASEGALSETRREGGSIGGEKGELRQLIQEQGRQIAAERRRVAELEQRLSAMVAELDGNRSEIDRYQTQIQENQEELTRYRAEMQATGEVLSRYRENLDAAQDRHPQSTTALIQSFSSGQTTLIGLAIVLLLLSMMTIAVLLRRSTAAGAANQPPLAQDRHGKSRDADGPGAEPSDGTASGSQSPSRKAKTDRSESEALAALKDPPRDRLLALAGGRIEVALPVLVHSEALTDADLIEIVRDATTQHRMAIAMRRNLGRLVVDALVATGEAKVLAAVLQNAASEVTAETLDKLAKQSEGMPDLKAALLERPGLPATLRERLATTEGPIPPTEAPRQNLAAKLEAAAAELDAAAAEQEAAARDQEVAAAIAATEAQPATGPIENARSQDAPAALDSGPAASGEVSPHALIEALRQGKLELFEVLFGKLTGLRPPRLQQVIFGAGGNNLAIACRALGLSKPVMTSIFIWSRKGRADLGAVNPRELSSAMTVYDATLPEAAQETVSDWIQGDAIPGEWDRSVQGPAAE